MIRMKELINWYYQLHIDHLEQLNDIYYTNFGDRYIYIISVGKEKNTVFFHLLQLLQYSSTQRVLLSKKIQRLFYLKISITMS